MGKRFEKRSLQERWDQRQRERDERESGWERGMVFVRPPDPLAPPTPVLPAVETVIEGVPGKAIKASPVRLENGMYAVAYDYVDPPGRSVYVAPPPPQKTDDERVWEAWSTLNTLAETNASAAFIVKAVKEAAAGREREMREVARGLGPKKPAEQPAPKSERVARGRRYFKLDD